MNREQLDSLLHDLSQLCTEAVSNLAELDEDQLLVFVERRADIVNAMEPYRALIDDADQDKIRTILREEQVIVERMNELKNEAAKWLEKRNVIRNQSHAYQQSYDVGSLFVDHRK